MLLTDSFLDYLLHERNYSKGTVEYYRADILELQRFGEEMLGDLTPSDVDAELVREWIASLMDKGLASNTINRKLSSVRTYYKFLLRRGKVAVDPLRKVTGPKKKKPLPVSSSPMLPPKSPIKARFWLLAQASVTRMASM